MTKALLCDDGMSLDSRLAIQTSFSELIPSTATFIFSLSGGKDSDAMTRYWLPILRERMPSARFVAVHADLGRAEWTVTQSYVERFCASMQLELHVVRHSKYDLLEGIRERMKKRPDAPPWPSSAARYCTSDWKRSVVSRWIRQNCDGQVAVLMGLRAEESAARAKRPPVSIREDATALTKGRTVYDILPIHNWTRAEVWSAIGYRLDQLERFQGGVQRMIADGNKERADSIIRNRFKAHPAYAYGNERLSCALCVLGSVNDLLNGIEHDHELFLDYCQIEVDSGFSLRRNFWLGALRPDLLTPELRTWYTSKGVLS